MTMTPIPSSSTTPSTSNKTKMMREKPVLPVLSRLQSYATASQSGHDALKASLWQLTKSRRNVRGVVMSENTSFQAAFVREELRARFRLFRGDGVESIASVAKLVDEQEEEEEEEEEDGPTPAPAVSFCFPNITTKWQLRDVVEERRHQRSTTIAAAQNDRHSITSPSNPTGLRQRQGQGKKSPDDDGSWTMVQEQDAADACYYLDEEEKQLLQKDPMELFGTCGLGSQRDLKVAQEKARQALDGYIQAANEVAAILKLIQEQAEKQP